MTLRRGKFMNFGYGHNYEKIYLNLLSLTNVKLATCKLTMTPKT